MPVLVRNTEKGPTVFSDVAKNIAIEWEGAGHPGGGDVQHVPDEVTGNVNFLKAVNRGILVVENASPEMEQKLGLQTDAYHERREAAEATAEESIDRQAERTLAVAEISEDGKTTTTISTETGQVNPDTGKPEETNIPVTFGPPIGD